MIGYELNYQRGFRLTFANGWTVSVVWGPGAYGSNYDADFDGMREKAYTADEAEVWAWNEAGDHKPDQPLGYQSPDDLAAFIAKVQRKKRKKAAA